MIEPYRRLRTEQKTRAGASIRVGTIIDKYLERIIRSANGDGVYAYRGQRKAHWLLHSGATRRLIREHGAGLCTLEQHTRGRYSVERKSRGMPLPIDTRCGSPKGHLNVNRVADALMKATGDSSRVAESSCDERPSGAPVAILHVPADSAGPLNVARYLAVIRLTAPCSPVGAAAAWIPPNRLWNVPG